MLPQSVLIRLHCRGPRPGFTRKLFAHARRSRKGQGAIPVLASFLPNFLLAFDAPKLVRRPQHG
jgi:hypothetical protein